MTRLMAWLLLCGRRTFTEATGKERVSLLGWLMD